MVQKRNPKRPDEISIILAETIRKLRKERGWTQGDVAQRYGKDGCKTPHITQLETGTRGFGYETQKNIAKAFGITIEQLLGMSKRISSPEMEEVCDLCAELRAGPNRELVLKVLQMVKDGPSEAIDSLNGLITLSKRATAKKPVK